jgi:hypothetical protein
VGNEAGLPEPVETFDSRSGLAGFIGLGASLHVTIPLRKSANNELLSQAGANSFRGSDCEIAKDKANAAVGSGEIEI